MSETNNLLKHNLAKAYNNLIDTQDGFETKEDYNKFLREVQQVFPAEFDSFLQNNTTAKNEMLTRISNMEKWGQDPWSKDALQAAEFNAEIPLVDLDGYTYGAKGITVGHQNADANRNAMMFIMPDIAGTKEEAGTVAHEARHFVDPEDDYRESSSRYMDWLYDQSLNPGSKGPFSTGIDRFLKNQSFGKAEVVPEILKRMQHYGAQPGNSGTLNNIPQISTEDFANLHPADQLDFFGKSAADWSVQGDTLVPNTPYKIPRYYK